MTARLTETERRILEWAGARYNGLSRALSRRKRAGFTLICVAGAVAVVSECLFASIPQRWRNVHSWNFRDRLTSDNDWDPGRPPSATPPELHDFEFQSERIGKVVHSATRAAVIIVQRPTATPPSAAALEASLAAVRERYGRFCQYFPEALPLFDAALASPTQYVIVEHPERRWASRLGIAMPWLRNAEMIAAGAGMVPFVAGLSRWLDKRRYAGRHRCASCGYSLAGLAAGAVCPECGKGGETK